MKALMGAVFAAGLTIAAPAGAARPEDEALNALYETLARGAASASAETIAAAFADDALLLTNAPGPALHGEAFRASLRGMSDKLRPTASHSPVNTGSVGGPCRATSPSTMASSVGRSPRPTARRGRDMPNSSSPRAGSRTGAGRSSPTPVSRPTPQRGTARSGAKV